MASIDKIKATDAKKPKKDKIVRVVWDETSVNALKSAVENYVEDKKVKNSNEVQKRSDGVVDLVCKIVDSLNIEEEYDTDSIGNECATKIINATSDYIHSVENELVAEIMKSLGFNPEMENSFNIIKNVFTSKFDSMLEILRNESYE